MSHLTCIQTTSSHLDLHQTYSDKNPKRGKLITSISNLPSNVINLITTILDLQTLGTFFCTSKEINQSINKDDLWWNKRLMNASISGYFSFINTNFELIKPKLKRFEQILSERTVTLNQIGILNNFPEIFIYRSMQDLNFNYYVYGGNRQASKPLLHQDLFKVNCDEQEGTIQFDRIELPDDHPPELIPQRMIGEGACMIGRDLFTFGGLRQFSHRNEGIENAFSKEFWCLQNATSQHKTDRRWILLNPPNNDQSTSMHVPQSRWGHSMKSYLAKDGQEYIIIFGGSKQGQRFNDLWIYSKTIGWIEITDILSKSNSPSPRAGHSATIVENFMYVLGGNNDQTTFNDFWRINVESLVQIAKDNFNSTRASTTISWECIHSSVVNEGGPEGSIGHSLTLVGSCLWFYGGRDAHNNSKFQKGVFMYDIMKKSWTKFKIINSDPLNLRTGPFAIPTSRGIFCSGGITASPSIPSHTSIFIELFGRMTIQNSIT